MLESPLVGEENKAKVRALIEQNDIMDLRERMDADLRFLARKLSAAPSGATSEGSDPRLPPSKARGRAAASFIRRQTKTTPNFGVVFI